MAAILPHFHLSNYCSSLQSRIIRRIALLSVDWYWACPKRLIKIKSLYLSIVPSQCKSNNSCFFSIRTFLLQNQTFALVCCLPGFLLYSHWSSSLFCCDFKTERTYCPFYSSYVYPQTAMWQYTVSPISVATQKSSLQMKAAQFWRYWLPRLPIE